MPTKSPFSFKKNPASFFSKKKQNVNAPTPKLPDVSYVQVLDYLVIKDEGDIGTVTFQFRVNRSGNTQSIVGVTWAVVPGDTDPANSADFGGSFPHGDIVFYTGDTDKTISVEVAGDETFENDENFKVLLYNPSYNALIISNFTRGQIKNDD